MTVTTEQGEEATLRVPRADGDGFRIRFVRLPPSVAGRPIRALAFEPRGGGRTTRLGHLFIYRDR